VEELIDWLTGRPYYEGQVVARRRVDGREPRFESVDLERRLESALEQRGIDDLYHHQATAVRALREGDDVVLATPTASGKSLAYTVPAFERAMDHGGRTLYVGPTNALVADQASTLRDLERGLGFGSRVSVASYTGRLSQTERGDVRDRRPTVLLTNPDMLHYALLPHAHRLWDWFFGSLETVVIDEVHDYRGVFGSHVALTLRRLNRVCERFGSDPQYVCCSATIGNPVEHAARVTCRDADSFSLVDEDTSGTGPTHWLFWNPPTYRDGRDGDGRRRSSHVETKHLFVDLVERGVQTLAFTRARQTAERYASDSAADLRERGEHSLADAVTAYQASLRDDRRREIETELRNGDLRGVWSTNALELGVDVGGLDAVLVDGYPGTRMATAQRAGRAGRGEDPALVVLVAAEDQLDQYLMRNPTAFFDGTPERAVADPGNDHLLPGHVSCAAAENWLATDDERRFGADFPDVVGDLVAAGELARRETDRGVRWTYDGGASPHQSLSLRSVEDRTVDLLDRRTNDVIASLSFGDALRDAHPGAIYHHQGQSYEVVELDLDRDVAELQPTWADYYTRVLHEKAITVERDIEATPLSARPDVAVRFAELTVRKQITGFERRDAGRGETLGRRTLALPETSLRTRGLYLTVPEDVERDVRTVGDFDGGIHAAEHGMISLFPLTVLCDRADVGGLSTPVHPHTGDPTIFIYDGYPGGVGLSRAGYETVESLMRRTARLIDGCDCADGCPACVQSPHCGNANEPLAKAPAVVLLDRLTGESDDGT
jgi:DEAD/DEAH box helicase domain-containing protein